MSETKRSRSVCTLWTIMFFIHTWAYAQAESPIRKNQTRSRSSHGQLDRQEVKREPSAIHATPNPVESRPSRPTVNGQAIPTGNSSPTQKSISSFPGSPNRNPSVLESTLSGRVEKWVGNFIPSRGTSSDKSKKLPIKTKIYIFKGKIKSNGTPDLNISSEESNKVFSVVNSNENGEFRVQLPPGEYTVFAEINGKLYRNSFDGEGFYSTTRIEDGVQTNEVITDSNEATF